MDYEAVYVDPHGRSWDLSYGEDGVLLLEGGLDGLSGVRATEGVRLAGVPGQIVVPGSATIEPVAGVMRVLLDPGDGHTMEQLYPAWVAAWSHDRAGRVELRREGGPLTWFSCRLGDEGLPSSPRSPLLQRRLPMDIPHVVDDGVFWERGSGTNNVTVTNRGHVFVWPRVYWSGSGGAVTMPSDAQVVLPTAADGERVFHFDPLESGLIADLDGTPDRVLWEKVRHPYFAESVPPGEERTYKLFPGARLEYDIGFSIPWR